jgi:hypothetical protein
MIENNLSDDYSLKIERLRTASWTLYITDEDGAAIDITGYTFYFTVKTNSTDVDSDTPSLDTSIIKKNITTLPDATSGKVQIDLTIVDTDVDVGQYVFDIAYKNSDGTDQKTILKGNLTVEQPITTRNE